MKTYFCVYFGALLLALLATPLVILLARRLKAIDSPGLRKIHNTPVPRLGGIALAVSMLAMSVCVLALDNSIGQAFRGIQPQVIALLAGAVLMLITGVLDDIHGLRARVKLAAQIAAAVVVCTAGIRIDQITVADWFTLDFGWLAWPITIFWIVGITNAVNLIDGLDGLAAGICAVACGVIAVLAIWTGQAMMAVIMLALLGSLTGFLVFNFNPARIFLGDSGTYFLGFVLGAGSVMCSTKSSTLLGLTLPVLALGVPIFDTLFSILRRILERRSIFAPDRRHIHHRLLEMGLHQRQVVIIIYIVTALAAGLGMFMMITRNLGTLVVFAGVLLLLALVFRLVGSVRLREAIAGLRQNMAVNKQSRQERYNFEQKQLLLREARSFQAWWQAICTTVEEMEFTRMSMSVRNRDGSTRRLEWLCTEEPSGQQTVIRMTVPVQDRRAGERLPIDVDVSVNGSLEAAGRRVALFSRLLEEHSLASLPSKHRETSRIDGLHRGRQDER